MHLKSVLKRIVLSIMIYTIFTLHKTHAFDFSNAQSRKLPIEIEADQGIVCEQEKNKCTAKENVHVKYGNTILKTDQLTAYFIKGQDGQQQKITRLEANNGVTITSMQNGRQKGYADQAVYNIDAGEVILTGGNLRLEINDGLTITARDSMRYYEKISEAAAYGQAVVIHDERRIQADEIHAFLEKQVDGRMSIHHVTAKGNVIITTKNETAYSNEGEYQQTSGNAILKGNVRIAHSQAKGAVQSQSDYMEINLNTGKSRLLSVPSTTSARPQHSQKVKILIMPSSAQ